MGKLICFLLAGLFGTQIAYAQARMPNIPYMDSVMASYLKQINYWASLNKYAPEESDSLIATNKKLMNYLKFIAADYKTIDARFPEAEAKGLMTMLSEDKQLRLYAWDTWTGNTMHYFNSLAQYRFGNNTAGVKVLNDITDASKGMNPGFYFTEINIIKTKNNRTVYLVTDCTVASENDKAQGIKAYTIENGELKNIPFFKTKRKITDNIDFLYTVTYDSLTSNIIFIHLSEDHKKLYIPVVLINGHLANEYWEYILKGNLFVYKKRVKGK